MAKKEGGYYWRTIAAVALVVALACGCAGLSPVKSGGALVSEEGLIAFTRATEANGMDIESEVYTINAVGSAERRLTDSPGLDGMTTWSRTPPASPSPPTAPRGPARSTS